MASSSAPLVVVLLVSAAAYSVSIRRPDTGFALVAGSSAAKDDQVSSPGPGLPSFHRGWRRRRRRQSDQTCSPCYPNLGGVASECFTMSQTCNGQRECSNGQDELGCHHPLSRFRHLPGVAHVLQGRYNQLKDVTLEGCARACNEFYTGCKAISYQNISRSCYISQQPTGQKYSDPSVDLYERTDPYAFLPAFFPSPLSTPAPVPDSPAGCAAGRYKCAPHSCIPVEKLCDGVQDCASESEETLCPSYRDAFHTHIGRVSNTCRLQTLSPASSLETCAAACLWYQEPGGRRCIAFQLLQTGCELGTLECTPDQYWLDGTSEYYLLIPKEGIRGLFNQLKRRTSSAWQIMRAIFQVGSAVSQHLSLGEQTITLQINNRRRKFDTQAPRPKNPFPDIFDSFGDGGIRQVLTVTYSYTSKEFVGRGTIQRRGTPVTATVTISPTTSTSQRSLSHLTRGKPNTVTSVLPPRPPGSGFVQPYSPLHEDLDACGSRPLDGGGTGLQARVVGGAAGDYGLYPWQAQLLSFNSSSGQFHHLCGAVIISAHHLLTAAHCAVAGGHTFKAMVGVNDRRLPDEPERQEFSVYSVVPHPEYYRGIHGDHHNDIAVVRLRGKAPIRFGSAVQPLCLTGDGSAGRLGNRCLISGWGKQLFGQPDSQAPSALNAANISIISTELCQAPEIHGSIFQPDRMVCAGRLDGTADTCRGDSGGPLACLDQHGHWTAVGIVSFGFGCGVHHKPGIYTRVASYKDWIEGIIKYL